MLALKETSRLQIQMAAKMADSPSGSLDAPGKLFVGGLPDRFTSHDLEEEFSRFGVIIDCHVHGREQAQSPNSHYGYITFDRESSAEAALKKMKNRVISRRRGRPVGPLRVSLVTESVSLTTSRASRTSSSPTSSPIAVSSQAPATTQVVQATQETQAPVEMLVSVPAPPALSTPSAPPAPPAPPASPAPPAASLISPTCIVEQGATIAAGCSIGHFSVILSTAVIGEGTSIGSHCTIGGTLGARNSVGPYTLVMKSVIIGDNNEFVSHVAVGARAEDYVKRDNIPTGNVMIGNQNVFREFVTIHAPEGERGGEFDGTTKIGDACYLMRGSHVGHDNVLGDRVTLACNTILAGYVRIGARANVGIGALVHQFTTIGSDTIVGMGSTVLTDIPPYAMFTSRSGMHNEVGDEGDVNPGKIEQLNIIGMMRGGIVDDKIDDLETWYRNSYRTMDSECFLECSLAKDWFAKSMREFHASRAKQNRRRPLTKVASGTIMSSGSKDS